MIHIFVPAVVAIYAKNIWIVISVIYLFESAEFMVSLLPNMEYWGDVGANALISDITMGLVGYWLISILGETEYKSRGRPWYAWLKARKCDSCSFYEKIVPYFHTILAAASSGVAGISIQLEVFPENSPYEFISFGILFTLFAIFFGKDRFAVHAFILISLISIIAIFTGYTFFVASGIVSLYYFFKILAKYFEGHQYMPLKNSDVNQMVKLMF